jgi:GAF domain-containing protein
MKHDDAFGIRRPERLADVARLGLDQEADRSYLHDIVERVALFLGTPFAVLDVLLDEAQVFLQGYGPIPRWIAEAQGTPLEWAFCQPLVRDRVSRAVPDLAEDPMFRTNPLVRIEGVRAYAGAPLISHSGHVLGGLCGLDVRPRTFRPDELAYLEELAGEAVARLEAHAPADALR